MNKREFVKTSMAGALGLFIIPNIIKGNNRIINPVKTFKLPELPYGFGDLEPHIDRETMMLHFTKHHQAYADQLNSLLQQSGTRVSNAREIIQNASKFDAGLVYNACGYLNHRLYWKTLSPDGGGVANGKISRAIDSDFGSFEEFKKEFSLSASSISGSGWVWLVNQNGKLKIIDTSQHENPFLTTLPSEKKGFPLMCLDIWEHSYYIKHQNNRSEYVDAFWKVVNWDNVNLRFNKSIS